MSKGLDDFSRLALTDGKENSSQLTNYTGSSLAKTSNQTFTADNFNAFKGNPFEGYTETGSTFVQVGISSRDAFMLKAQLAYKGYDQGAVTRMQKNIQFLLNNPSVELGAVTKQVAITTEDVIYINNLQKFIIENFFADWHDDLTSVQSDAFIELFKSHKSPNGTLEHKSCPLIYTLLYYFDESKSADPIEINRKHTSYNNFKFFFAPYAGGNEGEKIDLDLSIPKFPYGSPCSVSPTSKNTIIRNLSVYYSTYVLSFQFDASKIDDATFLLNVTMSQQENSKFVPQKIANIKVNIKK
jgi:hypothetical protein